jgi:hypothetical protein
MKKNVIASFMAVAVLLAIDTAQASHGRYAQITWTPLAGNTVEFTVQTAWRRSFLGTAGCVDPVTVSQISCTGPDGLPGIGDVVPILFILDFGDGSIETPYSVVTSIDIDNDWYFSLGLDSASLPVVDTTIEHTYVTPGSYIASFEGCCRIGVSGNNNHVNNRDGFYRVETVVDVGSGNSSPVSVLPPIQVCGIETECTISVPAADSDGDTLSFRLATAEEASGAAGGFLQPGEPGSGAPKLATIDPATGVYSWDTRGATIVGDPALTNNLYSTQIMIEDASSRVALDFLIRLTTVDPIPPEFANPDPDQDPVCGTTQVVTLGQQLTFSVDASDPDAGDTVQLNVVGLPDGAAMSPALPISGNPVSSTFSWIPTAEQEGVFVIGFSATSSGSGVGQTQCSVTVEVTETIFVDIDVSPGAGRNPINVGKRGMIPFVISTSETFDASTIDVSTLLFGPGEAMAAHEGGHLEDADGDGDIDLVIHVRAEDTGIQCGDTTATFSATTFDGQAVAGSSAIEVIGCD